ncbi:protein of unknown function [Pseudodesulfovibrio profundus]|uniref:Uncharacterized protein n=1 Tax=Pseudodesulfovibrio profundus TaxID=57320 RepID=A0A2C8FAC3_9BACT|nr:protein of unknown function [Pseudodesulfovibrio profundus]
MFGQLCKSYPNAKRLVVIDQTLIAQPNKLTHGSIQGELPLRIIIREKESLDAQ